MREREKERDARVTLRRQRHTCAVLLFFTICDHLFNSCASFFLLFLLPSLRSEEDPGCAFDGGFVYDETMNYQQVLAMLDDAPDPEPVDGPEYLVVTTGGEGEYLEIDDMDYDVENVYL